MTENTSIMICWVVFLICVFSLITFSNYNERATELKKLEVNLEMKKIELKKLQQVKDKSK